MTDLWYVFAYCGYKRVRVPEYIGNWGPDDHRLRSSGDGQPGMQRYDEMSRAALFGHRALEQMSG